MMKFGRREMNFFDGFKGWGKKGRNLVLQFWMEKKGEGGGVRRNFRGELLIGGLQKCLDRGGGEKGRDFDWKEGRKKEAPNSSFRGGGKGLLAQ